jgi:hypothetical protein
MKSEKRKPQKEFRWYKAIVPGAHLPHPGTREHYTYYVWATDAMFAYEKFINYLAGNGISAKIMHSPQYGQ